MSLAQEISSQQLSTEQKIFHKRLSSYTIVDLGILESITKTSKGIYGSLRSSKTASDGAVTRYTNVEIMNIGGSRAGFLSAGDGEDLYLVFGTVTSMPSTIDRKTDEDPDVAYSSRSLKAIPVASALSWVSRAGFDRSGNFTLEFPESSISFNVDSSFSYRHGSVLRIGKNSDGSVFLSLLNNTQQLFLMADGSWYTCIWGSGGYLQEIHIRRANGVQIRRRWSTGALSNTDKEDITNYTAFLFEEVLSTNGDRVETYKNSSGTTIAQEHITTAGKRTLTSIGFEVAAGAGKIKIANTVFNYSTWLSSVIDTLKTAAVDPGTHVVNAATISALTALQGQLAAGTE